MKVPKLNLFDLTMIVIGLVIGMGIFRTASNAARDSITPAVYFASWIAGGAIALCGALTYAEIGSRFPVTGGYYKIFAECYHPSIAFAVNCIILVSNAASLSGVALIGSEYISKVIFDAPPSNFAIASIAVGAIVLFYGVNLAGLRMSSKTQNVLMIIKIAMIVALISGLFFPSKFVEPSAVAAVPHDFGWMDYIKSFGMALVSVSFTYGGYQQTINFGEEVKNPRKNMSKGIFAGISIIIVLYLLVQIAYVKIIGFEQLREPQGIAAVVAERLFGPSGKLFFTFLLFFAVLAYVNVLLLSNPRVMYAMSVDGILPAAFKRKNVERDVLTVSLTAFAIICVVILFFANTFDKILGFTIFLDSIGMATSAATIFILRKKTKHLNGTGIYTMPLFPVLPLIFIAAYLFVGASIAFNDYKLALTGTGVFLGFLVLYFLTVKSRTAPLTK
jgi:APA family basic amino acid/polyamine antiporter